MLAPRGSTDRAVALIGLVALVVAAFAQTSLPARAGLLSTSSVPARAEQLVVMTGPVGNRAAGVEIGTLSGFARSAGSRRWDAVLGPWPVEVGAAGLLPAARRREGDRATPTGMFGIGSRVYGNAPAPIGVRYPYRRLVCGDWWDEDPYSPRYNQFVHVGCGVTPGFASRSEALWTEAVAYPYFVSLSFNTDPVLRGRQAPGSGIFIHSWVGGPTNGCIALRRAQLVALLRWLAPGARPVVEIRAGTAPTAPSRDRTTG